MIVEVHGHGSIAVIMASTTLGTPYSWHTLVEAADPERYTMVNFKYTIKEMSPARRDVTELAAYLENLGYEQIICVGGSLGAQACGAIANRPTTIALVLMAGFKGASYEKITIPKLFIAAENDFKQEMENQHRIAAEPKAIQIFPGGAHATDLFATESGDDVVKAILDFFAEVP
jgi:pimeloyl-ACP methyl ester carboxylesterase